MHGLTQVGRIALMIFGASLLGGNLNAQELNSKAALIFFAPGSGQMSGAPAVSALIQARLKFVAIQNELATQYRSVDRVNGNSADLISRILALSASGAVDVIATDSGDLSVGLRKQRLANLRMVVMAGGGQELTALWTRAGARSVVCAGGGSPISGFFLGRFAKAWAGGKSAQASMLAASEFESGAYAQLMSVLTAESASHSAHLSGANIDISGKVHASENGPAGSPVLMSDSIAAAAPSGIPHGVRETMGIQLVAQVAPMAQVDSTKVSSARQLLEILSEPAWQQLSDDFPGGPGSDGNGDITIDGQTARILAEPMLEKAGGAAQFKGILDELKDARLIRQTGGVVVELDFNEDFDFSLQNYGSAKAFAAYSVHVPRTVRVDVSANDGMILLTLDNGNDPLLVRAKFVGSVYPRNVSFDLAELSAKLEAGVVGNLFTVVAEVQISTQPTEKVDVMETIAANLEPVMWPELFFNRK